MVEDALPPLEEKVIQRLAENPLDWLDPAFAHEPGMIGYIWHHFCHHHNDYMDHSEVHKLAKACRLRFQEEFKAAIRKEQGELVEEDVVEEIYRKDKDQFLEGETEHDEVKTIEKFLFREINQGQTHTHHTIKKLAFYEHWALAAEKLFTIETNNSLNIGCCVIA